jgi:hypothetical protein
MFDKQGLLSAVIRVIWLFGATGLLLSLAGILSKMTLTASVDALGGMVKAAKQIVSIGALAASGVGAAAGAGAGAAGAAGAGAAGAGAPAAGVAGAGGALSGGEAAMSHLNAAQNLTGRAANFDALGLKAPAAYNRAQAHSHELAARQAELGERMQRFGGGQASQPSQPPSQGQDFGFSSSVNSAIGSTFQGSPQDFQKGFSGLSTHIQEHGLDPNTLVAQYPEDTSRMVQAYLDHGDEINAAPNPLQSAMKLGNTEQLQQVITFMPLKDKDQDKSA